MSNEQVCDVAADYSLGFEDYAEAIRLHREVLRKHPADALAHYHLGFAEGMLGNTAGEIAEYRRAEALGLRSWDLFLNFGLALAEAGYLDAAAGMLGKAVLLGEGHFEAHFNLALVDEQRKMMKNAEDEALASLRLSPGQVDARNLLGVIYAQEGQKIRASQVFRAILGDRPDYEPARTNLIILNKLEHFADSTKYSAPKPRSMVVIHGSSTSARADGDARSAGNISYGGN
jgi:tetratricopeptide (TPR) repeat protein